MTITEMIKKKVLGLLKLPGYETKPNEDRLTFINNDEDLTRTKLHEYNIWYQGDGDELLNYYTYNNTIEYNFEPIYMRNKKNYFWCVSSKESQIKRTHSGQPRNIVDTLTAIIPFPIIKAGHLDEETDAVNEVLKNIIEDSDLSDIFVQEQMPLALVEGWGCWKINWDRDISDYPIPIYYRAENVDFIFKSKRITGCIFKDYYRNNDKSYMLVETRHIEPVQETAADPEGNIVVVKEYKKLLIEKELFELSKGNNEQIRKVDFSSVPELKDTVASLEVCPCDILLAEPVILFKNTSSVGGYGRSIFTGKIDLFDDLDQCLSQASTSVRLSTPVEYFNKEYLERDKNGMPKRPDSFDRKYVMMDAKPNADGTSNAAPVTVTQPQLNFQQYSDQAVQILMQIINGIMSPATLGIDISKKDNAEAQREKEKVTIFTRNLIIKRQEKIFKSLCSQLLACKELMDAGKITVFHYDISVKFNEFADDSYENKLEKLGAAYDNMVISDEMFMSKLYGDTLSRADYQKELDWLRENHSKPKQEGMEGAAGGGMNPMLAGDEADMF